MTNKINKIISIVFCLLTVVAFSSGAALAAEHDDGHGGGGHMGGGGGHMGGGSGGFHMNAQPHFNAQPQHFQHTMAPTHTNFVSHKVTNVSSPVHSAPVNSNQVSNWNAQNKQHKERFDDHHDRNRSSVFPYFYFPVTGVYPYYYDNSYPDYSAYSYTSYPSGIWEDSSIEDGIPSNAIIYQSQNDTDTYYCRVNYNGELYEGVLVPDDACYINVSDEVGTLKFDSYQILVSD